MIRPFTCLAFLLACGSGLYLYQSKHRVKLLDEQIAQTVRSTDALREQTRMLSAEWTLLNDPERLRQLATQFLTLQTVSPNQFTSLAELDSRLPPPAPPGSQPTGGGAAPADQVPVAAAGPGGTGDDDSKPDAKVAAASPGSPKDTAAPRVALATPADGTQTHPADHKAPITHAVAPQPRLASLQTRPADQRGPEFHGADQRSPDQHGSEPRVYEQRVAETRAALPAPRVPGPVPMSPAVQSGGSFLGMAHDTAAPPAPLPLPRPMPVSAPNWSYSNGG